jgi:hypothetical protein
MKALALKGFIPYPHSVARLFELILFFGVAFSDEMNYQIYECNIKQITKNYPLPHKTRHVRIVGENIARHFMVYHLSQYPAKEYQREYAQPKYRTRYFHVITNQRYYINSFKTSQQQKKCFSRAIFLTGCRGHRVGHRAMSEPKNINQTILHHRLAHQMVR